MGILTQYGTDIARFEGDSVYDMMLISHHVGRYDSYGSIYSTYADCLGYRFDDKGKIYYNYDMIAYCDNGRIVKWIGGDTIAYYEGDVCGAAAAAIIFLFAPKNEDTYSTSASPAAGSDSSGGSSGDYPGGGGGGGGGGGSPGGTRGRGCGVFPFFLFSAVSLLMWYIVFTSSDAALGFNISILITVIILVCLLLNAFVFKNKDFNSIYISTLLITSIICFIICLFSTGGYSVFIVLLVCLICVPLVIGALCYIPSFITYHLIKLSDYIAYKKQKDSTGSK